MAEMVMTKKVEEELLDLHRGLHFALDHLVNRGDKDEAERVLRQIDVRMSHLLNTAKVTR